jgi:hypothetical protein
VLERFLIALQPGIVPRRGDQNMAGILAKVAAILAAAAGTVLLTAAWSVPGDPSGTQRFVFTTHSMAATPVYRAVATGVFSATGTAQAASKAATAPLKVTFPNGTLLIGQVSAGRPSRAVNTTTCAVAYTETGARYTVATGTGRYKGISGRGTGTAKFTGRLPRLSDGKCNEAAPPVAGTTTSFIDLRGPVTLP